MTKSNLASGSTKKLLFALASRRREMSFFSVLAYSFSYPRVRIFNLRRPAESVFFFSARAVFFSLVNVVFLAIFFFKLSGTLAGAAALSTGIRYLSAIADKCWVTLSYVQPW